MLFANCAAHVCLWKPLPHLTSPLSLAPADQEEEGRMSGGRSKPSVTFTVSIQLSSLALTSVNTTPTTPLPYHLPLHPVTMTTSQPTGSALRCVPLIDSCIPLGSSSLKTHAFSATSMQDPSAHSGGGLTYPPLFRTITSTSCCWRRPGCALPVTRPRSPTWLRLGTRASPSPALQDRGKRRGHRLYHKGLSEAACLHHFVLSCSAPLLWNRAAVSNLQQATDQLRLYLLPSIQQKEQILWLNVFRSVFRLSWTLRQLARQNSYLVQTQKDWHRCLQTKSPSRCLTNQVYQWLQ